MKPTYLELAALLERAVLKQIDEQWLMDAKAALWDITNGAVDNSTKAKGGA